MNTLGILINATVGAAVILGLSSVAVMMLRRVLSASVRHAVWVCGLICVSILPILLHIVAPIKVEIPPRLAAIVPLSRSVNPKDQTPTLPNDGSLQQQVNSAASGAPKAGTDSSGVDLSLIVLWIWGVIAVALIVRLGVLIVLPRRLMASSEPLVLELPEGADGVRVVLTASELGMVSPMTWGFLKPVVSLPHSSMDWPEDRRRAALLHELAHVTRRDWLLQTFAQAVCAVYWFHPLVWLAARQMRIESERACDDLVVTTGGMAPVDYASHLLDIVRSARQVRTSGALAMAQGGDIEPRLRAVLSETAPRRAILVREVGIIGLLAILGLYLTASIRVSVAQAQWGAPPPDAEITQTAEALSGFSASFPNASDIKLVVLTIPGIPSAPWWSPNGGRLAKPPIAWPKGFFSSLPTGPNLRTVAVVLKQHYGNPRGDNSMQFMLSDPSQASSSVSAGGTAIMAGTSDEWWFYEFSLPKSSPSCVVAVAEPTQDWHELGVWRASNKNTASAPVWQAVSARTGVNRTLTIGMPRAGALRMIKATCDLPYWKKFVRQRLIPIGKDGRILKMETSAANQINGHFETAISLECPLSSVKEFKLEECGYRWVQFPAVNVDVPK